MKITSSETIIKSLLFEKIEFIFGYPGGAVLHIYDALFFSKIKHILVRHEQAATHIADGYSRSSTKIGVVLTTSGPGFTNCITGIATSLLDSSSILIICGQVNKNLIAQNSFQEINNLGIILPISNQFFSINCYYNIVYIIKNSFNIFSIKKGPIIIDFPKNLTSSINKNRFKFPFFKNNKKLINKNIFIYFNYSKRPIIVIGGGSVNVYVYNLILKFINNLKIPYVISIMGISGINYRSKFFLGWIGMHGDPIANILIHYSDLLLCISTRLDDRITNSIEKFSPYSKIIHIDLNNDSICKTIKCNIFFKNNILNYLKNFFNFNLKKKWWKKIIFFINFFKYNYKNDFFYCKPQQIIELTFFLSRGKFFVTTDVGQHQMFTAKYYFFNYKKFITSGGLGTMGFGFPCSIGIKFANKNSKILLFTGEGSFQMMMQELSTCKQYNINIFIINLNNQSLGMVKQWQEINYSNRYSNSYVFSLPNFKKLINSYNFFCFNFYKIKLFYIFLKNVIFKNLFFFLNIYIDNKENVFPIQIFNKSMNEFIHFFSLKKYDKKFNFFI
ncbi:thiamine pyrophosphate-dependent enzyme [Candidatus Carsonella ruddii]|uniref:Acetolactate synthase large subunit n=1 Tax=Candidatus Carsonella ruddii CE isolate Thao2000 TaxID=1202536 RepID=J7H012_CARRU|nr:thiamine pyrophosphate-dependent enzyme [Candidatus Carsonella ruddii]AFP83610.1 acetolactate synthase large subunit [Candidatus Carsonella ruddii CE isolate Thao2000]